MTATKSKLSKMQRKENLWGWFLVSPIVIKALIFVTIPTLYCLFVSFTNYNILAAGQKFTEFTLDSYKEVLHSKDFWRSMYNTVYLLISLPIRLVIGFLVAYILNNRAIRFKGIFRVMYYIPAVSSVVAVALVWKWFFNTDGVFNEILGTDVAWLIDPAVVKNSLIIKSIWGGFGSTMLMYFAGMQNISEDLFEAADIDGAGGFVKMTKISLPLLRPITLYLLVTGISGGLNAFADNYTMVSGSASNTAVFWIYNQFIGGNYPLVGAASFILTLFVVIFSIPQYRKMVKDN